MSRASRACRQVCAHGATHEQFKNTHHANDLLIIIFGRLRAERGNGDGSGVGLVPFSRADKRADGFPPIIRT